MGLFKRSSDNSPTWRETLGDWVSGYSQTGNPNKHNFSVVRRLDIGKVVVVEVKYPDCRNHDGKKILVYDKKEIFERGVRNKSLDPHFLEIGNSPVARFEPSETGWIFAISFAKVLSGQAK